jgi:DNA-binding transcriptional MerR regulator
MSKAVEAFRTISEVADELAVPKHVLRFWEAKFPQIKPMKRGIRHLLHAEGYTIKGVQKILREQGIDQVKAFAEKAAKLEAGQGKGKRGRPPRLKGGEASVSAAPKRPVSREEVIDKLIAELEACRAILGAKVPGAGKTSALAGEAGGSRSSAGGRAS